MLYNYYSSYYYLVILIIFCTIYVFFSNAYFQLNIFELGPNEFKSLPLILYNIFHLERVPQDFFTISYIISYFSHLLFQRPAPHIGWGCPSNQVFFGTHPCPGFRLIQKENSADGFSFEMIVRKFVGNLLSIGQSIIMGPDRPNGVVSNRWILHSLNTA